MAQQLKRWESPRRKGRNHKGRGGSAKQRQYKKRQKLLMKRLQKGINSPSSSKSSNAQTKGRKTKYSEERLKERPHAPLFFCP
ncbi:MAG: hypothetical protein AAFZ17_12500 [Cyanobacteria bacterium J06650_10]